MTYYPGTTPTFTTKTNKVDLVDASHVNDLQNEVVALATELGTNPSESRTTVKERLNTAMDAYGAVNGSNGYPDGVLIPTYARQFWYRTDSDSMYIRNAANTAWVAVGQNFSNMLFQYQGVWGAIYATKPVPEYIAVTAAAFVTAWRTQILKWSGLSSLNISAALWTTANGQPYMRISVGGVLGSCVGVTNHTAPSWYYSGAMNVSGLSNGTYYDVIAEYYDATAGGWQCNCGAIIGYGS